MIEFSLPLGRGFPLTQSNSRSKFARRSNSRSHKEKGSQHVRIAATCPIASPPAVPHDCAFCTCTRVDQSFHAGVSPPSFARRSCILSRSRMRLKQDRPSTFCTGPTPQALASVPRKSCCICTLRLLPDSHPSRPQTSILGPLPLWSTIAPTVRARVHSHAIWSFSIPRMPARATRSPTRVLAVQWIGLPHVEGFVGSTTPPGPRHRRCSPNPSTTPPIRPAFDDRPCHVRMASIVTTDWAHAPQVRLASPPLN